jgi:uncharacterized membrane protein YfcA
MEVVLALALGFCAGVLAGLFVPTLALALGLEQLNAQATSLAAMLPVVLVGTWRQQRYGNVRFRPAVLLGLAGAGGVLAGGLLAESLSNAVLEKMFGALLLATAAQLAWRALQRPATR